MRLGRKISGGRYTQSRKKIKNERARQRRIVKLGAGKKKKLRMKSGKKKTVMLSAKEVNVQTKSGKKKLEIKNVLETPSNKFLARQNVITKGTIIQTEAGKVRVTNRPGQEGMINGILVE
ncbi:MAG: 30S ribosomal protein S8e [Nanoarchaeota archaeon]